MTSLLGTPKEPYQALPIEDVAALLSSDLEEGLSDREALERARRFGPNILEKEFRAPWLLTLIGQFKSPFVLLLLAASAVTTVIGDYKGSLFILAAVIVNAGLGYYQEHKAERALAELKTYLRQRARVIRDGREREIDATELVPGDLIRLAQGDRVPADARLVFVNDLQADEAVLTGEALPSGKTTEAGAADAGLGDQRSMAFAGTLITQGVGTALVCRTGAMTELGKIAELVGGTENEETPLQAAVRAFSLRASLALGVVTLLIFLAGIYAGEPLAAMFVTAVAIAVSAVPEGLPIAMTVILAIGVQRMARRKGVVRRLAAAEALGSADVILTDKTGTLTTARMEIGALIPEPGTDESGLLRLALENANVLVENPSDPPEEWRIDGRIIEASLVRSAALRGVDVSALIAAREVKEALPFNAVNKFSASVVKEGDRRQLVFVGAPDILLARSALNASERARLLERINTEAGAGALVLGIASRELGAGEEVSFKDIVPAELSFLGLVTLHDPIRPNVPAALALVEEAGIRVVLVTGDHRGTAVSVARAAGMRISGDGVLDAVELRNLSDAELALRLPTLEVVARVSPLDKMRIVKAFQAAGKSVAMTGDGVNDAPGIRQADIGIAMGSGTAVARDVADLVLLDDNFETIAAAVEEGRRIRGNLRKTLVYLLSDTANELFLIGGALLAGLVIPLTALQILWVNFFSDSFPAIAFAFEKEKDAGMRPAQGRGALFDPLMSFLILFIGIATSAFLFILYWGLLAAGYPGDIVRTFIFASFASYTLFSAFALRSLTKSVLTYPFFGNPAMLAGVGFGLALVFLGLYVPFLQGILDTVPLPLPWLIGVLGVALLNITAIELAKWVFRSRMAR
ncbi:MAG: HAD-IC family P-type ATPase [bacterium]